MSDLIEDIEDSLIDLSDDGYEIKVKSDANHFMIDVINRPSEKLEYIKRCLSQSYYYAELHGYEIIRVSIDADRKPIEVKPLDKDKYDLVDRKFRDWEDLWNSIDFCLFRSSYDPDYFYRMQLHFRKKVD